MAAETAPNPVSRRQLRALFSRYGFRPRKSLGQTFLVDANIAQKIVAVSGVRPGDGVLEVGPGAGALTRTLAALAGRVVAVEIDPVLVSVLRETVQGPLTVVEGDVLAVDWPGLLGDARAGDWKVVANLPYAITGPALLKLLDARDWVDRLTLMVQDEVAARVAAPPGSRARGLISVFVEASCEVELAWRVSRTCFYPTPRVDSAVLSLTVRHPERVPRRLEACFRKVVRAAFSARRKMLVNALSQPADMRLTKVDAVALLRRCSIASATRAESLSVEDFLCLAEAYAAMAGEPA